MSYEQPVGDQGQYQGRRESNSAAKFQPPHHPNYQQNPSSASSALSPAVPVLSPYDSAQTFFPPHPFNPSALPSPPRTSSSLRSPVFPNNSFSPGQSGGSYELSPLMTNMFGAALTSPGLSSASFAQVDGMSVESPNGTSKVIQKADRSCKKCRERRVRCDRQYPECARCKKRREECSYGQGVFVETVEEGSDAAKIADLEAKVVSLETQLKSSSSKNAPQQTQPFSPAPSRSSSLSSSLAQEELSTVVARAVTVDLTSEERNVLDALVNEQDQVALYGVVDRRGLVGTKKDVGITCYLLDSSIKACCTKLPGLHLLRDRLPYFKANLHSLEPPHQLAVVCLCSIGVRVHPNSALFGIASVNQADGTPIPQLFHKVGFRREKICDALSKAAMEACWALGIVRTRSYDNLDALVGLVQYLLHEEGRPEEARFFVREMVGMFLDLRHEEMAAGISTRLNESNTTAVFLADAFVSSTCHKPSFITPIDLQDYFTSSGLRVPDLVNMQLGDMIEETLGSPLDRPAILNMLTSLCLYVFSCHRVFAQVANPRRANGASILPFLRNLWSVLDQIHNAVQRLQQHLVNLTSAPAGYADDPQAIDHAILLAVRADNSLVDLIMLIHVHLREKYTHSTFWPEKDGDEELERMRAESSMRVYKCLKLLAFYCQLYLASQDKHNIFHLLLRLEVLPDWTEVIAKRIGSSGGPISDEFEVTQEELDWFRCALELACYYSSRGMNRLASLEQARQGNAQSSYLAAASPSTTLPSSSSTQVAATKLSASPLQQGQSTSPTISLLRSRSPSHQHQSFDTPPSTSSTIYTSSSTSTYMSSIESQLSSSTVTLDANSIPQLETKEAPSDPLQPSVAATPGPDFEMQASSLAGFADGAGQDPTSETHGGVQNAFRSFDWGDLSLTPAMGSCSDGSSVEGEPWKKNRKH